MARATFKLIYGNQTEYFLTHHGLKYTLREYCVGLNVAVYYYLLNGSKRELRGRVTRSGSIVIRYPSSIINIDELIDVHYLAFEHGEKHPENNYQHQPAG